MRILGISGSPRQGGNTEIAVRHALKTISDEGLDTEFVSLAELPVLPCVACGGCRNFATPKCVQNDPNFDLILQKVIEADGLIVGSPVYFSSATPQLMALLDRIGYVTRPNLVLRRKVGAAIAVARRAGTNFTFAQMNYFFLISEMIVPGSTYWNNAFGLKPGDVEQDEEGMQTITSLAKNVAWLVKKLTEPVA